MKLENKEELNKEVDETTNQNALTDETNESESMTDENGLKKQDDEKTSDEDYYKEELDRLQKERDNYKQGLLNAKEKLKKQKENVDENINIDEDLEERLAKRIEETVLQAQSKWQLDRIQDDVTNTINAYSNNDDEAELIKYHYENTIKQSGTSKQAIDEDVKIAKLLANRKRLELENEELAMALRSKTTVNKERSVSGQKMNRDVYDIKFSDADLALLNRRGINPKEAAKRIANKK